MRALALTALLAALPGVARAAPGADAADADFEAERGPRSIAMGPLPGGSPVFSLDAGWLRSGLRLDLGLFGGVDLVLRADGMLLYDGLRGQNGLHVGARFTPVAAESGFRLGVEFTGGVVLVSAAAETVTMTTLRGELVLGTVFDLANVYARLAVRGVDAGVMGLPGWVRDEEVGLGVERVFFGRWVLAAEGYTWARPHHAGLGQWRIRVGFSP